MHKFSMPEEIIARVVARVGRTHPFDKLEASKTAFVVIEGRNVTSRCRRAFEKTSSRWLHASV